MLRSKREKLRMVNYALLIVAFGVCRLGICTWMGVLFTEGLAKFTSESAFEWTMVIIQYGIFAFVWALSWYFVYAELKPALGPLITSKVVQPLTKWRQSQANKSALRSLRASAETANDSTTKEASTKESAVDAGLRMENV